MDDRQLRPGRRGSHSEYSRGENSETGDTPRKNVRQSRSYPLSLRDGQRSTSRSRRRECWIHECLAEISRRMEPVRRKLLESAKHRSVYVRWNGTTLSCDCARLLGHHTSDDCLHGRSRKWRLSNQHLV